MGGSSFTETSSVRMMTGLMQKPLKAWDDAVKRVKQRGYNVWEEWASPVIGGRDYEVRLRSGYPDARQVIVSLHRREGEEPLREECAASLFLGVDRAVDWLDEVDRRRLSHLKAGS